MPASHASVRRAASLLIASLTLPGIVDGCSHPTQPVTPPGGGSTLTLSFEQFERAVEPVLVRHGCDATGDCHGGGIRGSLELSPAGAKNARFDFDQIALQTSATNRDASPVLTEPLALVAGGTPHAVKPFASISDSGYVAVRGWILAGVTP